MYTACLQHAERHLELSERYAKVGLVESVRNVPTERTELAAFLDDGVEETQTVHQLVERLQTDTFQRNTFNIPRK